MESIYDENQSNGAIKLIEGAGACPPEDSIGQPDNGCKGYQQLCLLKQSNPLLYKEKCSELESRALNYKSKSFIPIFFLY